MEAYLICFDISDDSLRRHIAKTLLSYGNRVQRSVFEVAVQKPEELTQLRIILADIVPPDDRDIRFYRLCADCRRASQQLDGERIADFPAMMVV